MSGKNATNRFAEMDHRAPTPPGITINRTGPGWLAAAGLAEAADSTLVLHPDPAAVPPLATVMRQVHEPPLPPEPAPPTPPTEAELRSRIEAAKEAQHQADTVAAAAAEAHARAVHLVEQRKRALAAFTSLDDQVLQFTLTGLREDGRCELPPGLRNQMQQREAARSDLAVAEHAAATLATELGTASTTSQRAARQTETAIAAVLARQAERIADQRSELLKQADVLLGRLYAFDGFCARSGGVMSPRVAATLRNTGNNLVHLANTSAWREAAATLRDDPQAEIGLTGD